MKRLLLLVALALPSLGLYSCVTHVKVPTATTIIKEAHEAFPTLPEVQTPELPADLAPPSEPKVKPDVRRRHVDHAPRSRSEPAQRVTPPTPRRRPQADQAPLEELPPQQGVICIFPFNLIPNCTPEPAGRQP